MVKTITTFLQLQFLFTAYRCLTGGCSYNRTVQALIGFVFNRHNSNRNTQGLFKSPFGCAGQAYQYRHPYKNAPGKNIL